MSTMENKFEEARELMLMAESFFEHAQEHYNEAYESYMKIKKMYEAWLEERHD